MKRIIAVALMTCATLASAQSSPAKKELVAKLLALQQPAIEGVARGIVERPAMQMMQAAGQALQQPNFPADKREAVGRSIEADVKKFVEESTPIARERASKLAPSTIGATLEEKLSEDDLRQLIAWYESPVNKKYQQIVPEMQSSFAQKLIAEISPLLDPKLKALEAKVRGTFAGVMPGSAAGNGAGKAAPSGAKPPARPASN